MSRVILKQNETVNDQHVAAMVLYSVGDDEGGKERKSHCKCLQCVCVCNPVVVCCVLLWQIHKQDNNASVVIVKPETVFLTPGP